MKSRKELKEEYKKKKSQMGIFQIRNNINNKVFIDHSVDMFSKWNRHKTELNLGSHQNKSLLKDWRENGEDNFLFEILSILKENDQESVNYRKELKLLQKMVVEEITLNNFY